jgi:acyl-coenzyme A thioesterase PaaI-like protein
MNIKTHKKINQKISGIPLGVEKGESIVKLKTTEEMITDEQGLIHGGFIYSTADYAAMLAVNHPNVVLGKSSFKFIKPMTLNETLFAKAKVIESEAGKKIVKVQVKREEEGSNDIIAEGEFICFIPKKHVLEE